ncbi:uncharacterized protein LOC121736010 isoform X2 [Aricia agestis]|uniref:uncharacterized protein LOC121736010 isoform X2 n=1 Tax=Aricia agestis TaxID=91739 RepID=UPI001C20297C|nr:uncharacterized protein LOC121736010 isoform X2 [Aricia agestis]
MLKFLTHKLRTHSLNEENVSEKVEERDSGTESDDEADRTDAGEYCADVIMKWNDVTDISMSSGEACACAPAPPRPAAPEPDHLYDHHSSEEELEVETPVRFRTSPPLEALKPRRAVGAASCACAGRASPRRRRAPLPPPRRHRPALDFDKMQQLKVGGGGVRSWRAVGGAHGGELSVFCW